MSGPIVVSGCVALLLAMATGCSSQKDPKSGTTPEVDVPGDTPPRSRSNEPGIESEIGALDEKAVNAVFRKVRGKVTRCLRDANDGLDLPVVGGDITVKFRVKGDGSVRWVVPLKSTLGDRDAEKCVMNVLSSKTWPTPEGGDEGLAKTEYGIDPPGRAATAWSPGDLGAKAAKAERQLDKCRSEAGATSLSITLYIDPDGKVITAGGAIGDENGPEAIDCGIDALQGMTFPSPGSYPAKVTLRVD